MNYNFVRVLLSGGRTLNPNTKEYSKILNQKYIKNNLTISKVKNITFYKKNTDKDNIAQNISGDENIYKAKFTGYLFEQYTGEVEAIDKGFTNDSGFYVAEGFNTGTWVNPRTISEKFNSPIYPMYPPTPEGLFLPTSENIFFPKDLITIFGSNKNQTYMGKILQGPTIIQNKIYTGVFGGFITLNDIFYDQSSKSLSVSKRVEYLVSGSDKPIYSFDVMNLGIPTGTGASAIPGTIILNNILSRSSGIASGSGDYLVEGYILSYPFIRGSISGFANISGFITGQSLESNSGIFKFNGIRSGLPLSAKTFSLSGGQKASGILRYRNPDEDDIVIIENPEDGVYASITYNQSTELTPPEYFNSIISLNNIINDYTGRFNMTSEIIDLTPYGYNNESGLKLIYDKIGDIGNSTTISSFGTGSPILITGESLSGGLSIYQDLTPTGLYFGNLNIALNPTGNFVRLYDENIYAQMNKNVGFKTFTGIWKIFGTEDGNSFINLRDFSNLETGKINSIETEAGDLPENLYILKVIYANNSKSTDTDVAELKIFRNNIEKTGIILKGTYSS